MRRLRAYRDTLEFVVDEQTATHLPLEVGGTCRPHHLGNGRSETCNLKKVVGPMHSFVWWAKSSITRTTPRDTSMDLSMFVVGIGRNTGPLKIGERSEPLALEASQPDNRGSMAQAMDIASNQDLLAKATSALTGNFLAASSSKGQAVRRAEILALARRVAKTENVFPLAKATVVGVAAALRSAGFLSGSLYLRELKLLHVEEGLEIAAWLDRCFKQCSRALDRGKGPTKRAPEAPTAAIPVESILMENSAKKSSRWPGLSYAWACAWMLREIELSKMKPSHIKRDPLKRQVSIYIPLSKTDQGGKGVRRTIGCCGGHPCIPQCAWWLCERIVERIGDLGNRDSSSPLFLSGDGKALTKHHADGGRLEESNWHEGDWTLCKAKRSNGLHPQRSSNTRTRIFGTVALQRRPQLCRGSTTRDPSESIHQIASREPKQEVW